MSQLKTDANHCFVCGPANPSGLHLEFRLDGDICRSEYTPLAEHCGYDGVTHGGLIYSVLDDVMANWIFLQGARAYTARCEVRYKASLPTGVRVRLESECLREKGRMVSMAGRMVRDDTGEVVAEAEAAFMKTE